MDKNTVKATENEVFPLATIRELLPACGPKSLECFRGLALTRKEVKEVVAIVTEYKVSTYKVVSMMAKKELTLKQVIDILNLAGDYGHLASYNQMVRIFRLCGDDIEVVEFFLDNAEEFISYSPISCKIGMGHLLHIIEDRYPSGDPNDPGRIGRFTRRRNSIRLLKLFMKRRFK